MSAMQGLAYLGQILLLSYTIRHFLFRNHPQCVYDIVFDGHNLLVMDVVQKYKLKDPVR